MIDWVKSGRAVVAAPVVETAEVREVVEEEAVLVSVEEEALVVFLAKEWRSLPQPYQRNSGNGGVQE